MVFLNNDRNVSVGLTQESGYQSSKSTAGQAKLWSAFCQCVDDATPIASGCDLNAHNEFHFKLFNGIAFALTDVAEIGGVSVASDGLYVVKDGNIYAPRFETQP